MVELPEPYGYENTYIHLKVPMPKGLLSTLRIEDHTLLLKSEFHISLIKTAYAAELINENDQEQIQAEIVEVFREFIKKQHLDMYKPTGTFRFAEIDDRKTLIGIVEVPHLTEFFSELNNKYGLNIPVQPTHITMYTLQPERGIGILSEQQLKDISKPVGVPELTKIQFVPVSK